MAGWKVADEVEGTQKDGRDDDNAEDLDNDYHMNSCRVSNLEVTLKCFILVTM